jgi:hypothetical protein
MFTERHFTEKDARALQGLLSLFFPLIFHVRYIGIYGELGTPGKFAYAVTFQRERREHQISRFADVEKWLSDELDTTQSRQVIDLLQALTTSKEADVRQ